MVIRNYHWPNSASRVLISTCSAPLVQTGEQFFTVWPWPLTYNHRLAKVKVGRHAKNQGQRSNGSNRRAPTNKRTNTHTDATKRIISPAMWSITKSDTVKHNNSHAVRWTMSNVSNISHRFRVVDFLLQFQTVLVVAAEVTLCHQCLL